MILAVTTIIKAQLVNALIDINHIAITKFIKLKIVRTFLTIIPFIVLVLPLGALFPHPAKLRFSASKDDKPSLIFGLHLVTVV